MNKEALLRLVNRMNDGCAGLKIHTSNSTTTRFNRLLKIQKSRGRRERIVICFLREQSYKEDGERVAS